MKTYKGNVEITKENQKEWEEKLNDIEKISGGVYIHAAGVNASLPLLKEVGGDVSIHAAGVTLPLLKEVGGGVYIHAAGVTLPTVTHNPTPIRYKFAKHGYLFADNILSRIVSKKKQGKIVVYKTRKIGNRRKLVYVVQKGELFSHGDTVKQAIRDFRYKLTDRDTTKYQNWTVDSIHPIADIIQSYRAITGACETGTKMWCGGKELPAKMSVKEAIDKTTDAWGNAEYAAFFKKGEK